MKQVFSLVVGLMIPLAVAADQRPVVAVFDVQIQFFKLPQAKRDMLTNLLGQELGIGGVYQVMPPGDVKRALVDQSAESYKECFDEKCQIQLGRQLPANKLVTTTVMKMGKMCRVAASLYDLKRQTTDLVAKEKCGCDAAVLAGAIEKVAAKLRAVQAGSGGTTGFVEEDLGEKPAGDWAVGGGQEVIVEFASVPSGAVVLVDGNLACQQTPCSKSVARGKHLVSMQAPRYGKRQERLVIAQGTSVSWKLDQNFGWLTVRSDPAGLAVTVNGREIGVTPIEKKEWEPGVYKILVSSPCHYDAGKKVRVVKGQEQTVEVTLKEKQGAVKVSAKDGKGNDLVADVYVDGKKVGRTPGTYKVSICAKELKVKHPKKGSAKKILSVKERKIQSVNVVPKLPRSAEVDQPGTKLFWLRCPLGKTWDGSMCQVERSRKTWDKAKELCSEGYRLPTRRELAGILGGCGSNLEKGGRCVPCAKSSPCRTMFGKDRGTYWSSEQTSFDKNRAWRVSYGGGQVRYFSKGMLANVRCVRHEP
jgi:hypothetical protein